VIDAALSEEAYFESDRGRVWAVVSLQHSKRGSCCLGVLDWSTGDQRFVAAYATRLEVVSALRELGYLDERQVRPNAPARDRDLLDL
jgi:hypothetical protein